MTAVLVGVPCTKELLDDVPVGGRVVRVWDDGRPATVFHRTDANPDTLDAWLAGPNTKGLAGLHLCTIAILAGFGGKPVTVHHPGMVRVLLAGESWRGWKCRDCGDDCNGYDSVGAAGDDARAHVRNHLEIRATF